MTTLRIRLICAALFIFSAGAHGQCPEVKILLPQIYKPEPRNALVGHRWLPYYHVTSPVGTPPTSIYHVLADSKNDILVVSSRSHTYLVADEKNFHPANFWEFTHRFVYGSPHILVKPHPDTSWGKKSVVQISGVPEEKLKRLRGLLEKNQQPLVPISCAFHCNRMLQQVGVFLEESNYIYPSDFVTALMSSGAKDENGIPFMTTNYLFSRQAGSSLESFVDEISEDKAYYGTLSRVVPKTLVRTIYDSIHRPLGR